MFSFIVQVKEHQQYPDEYNTWHFYPLTLLLTTTDKSFGLLMCLLELFRGCCQSGKNILK